MNRELNPIKVIPEMLFCDAMEADEHYVWLLVLKFNILIEIERDTGIMSPCGIIPCNQELMIPYRCLFKCGEKLILFPYDEKDICIYDIEKKTFEHVALNYAEQGEGAAWKFTGCVRIKDRILVYGGTSVVLLITLPEFAIHYLDLRERLPEDLKVEYWFWRYSYVKDKTVVLMPQCCSPCIVELDIFKGSVKFERIPQNSDACIDFFAFVKSDLYYIDRRKGNTTTITKYDLQLKECEVQELGIEKSERGGTFGFVSYVNNALWMLPGISEHGYRLFKGKVEKLYGLPTVSQSRLQKRFPCEFNYRCGLVTEDSHILSIHTWSGQLVDINTIDENIQIIPIVKDKDLNWTEWDEKIWDNSFCNICEEWISDMFGIYMSRVFSNKPARNNISKKNIGNIIYRTMIDKTQP